MGNRKDAAGMEDKNNFILMKEKDHKRIKNYRGVTLLKTANKIYAVIQNEKIKKEIETKGMLPEADFRKKWGQWIIYIFYSM